MQEAITASSCAPDKEVAARAVMGHVAHVSHGGARDANRPIPAAPSGVGVQSPLQARPPPPQPPAPTHDAPRSAVSAAAGDGCGCTCVLKIVECPLLQSPRCGRGPAPPPVPLQMAGWLLAEGSALRCMQPLRLEMQALVRYTSMYLYSEVDCSLCRAYSLHLVTVRAIYIPQSHIET